MAVAEPALIPAARPLPTTRTPHAGHRCCLDRRNGRSLVGVAEDGYRLAILPLACRSWRCACCAVKLRRRNRARAFRGATGRVAMVTLTIPAGRFGDAPNRTRLSIRHASQSWNRLRLDLKRSMGELPYFRGLELTKAGVAHLHVVVRVASLSDFWRLRQLVRSSAVGAGFGKVSQVDLARRPGDVAKYVTKAEGRELAAIGPSAPAYATKGIDQRMPKWTRRASWSADWASSWIKPTPIAGFTWSVRDIDADGLRELIEGSDFVLVDPDGLRVPIAAGRGPAGGIA